MSVSRRRFLHRLGAVGGYSAAYLGMQAMGLLPMARAYAGPPVLGAGSGAGRSVVILGAGIAGLVSAYELQRAGYAVTVLEARQRVGGRAWTIRGGDTVEQIGRPDQVCAFDSGLYFNAGPARIPTHHRAILGYARDLGVPLEVMVNVNRSAATDFHGVVAARQAINDTRGRIAELLAKAIDQGALQQDLTGADRAAVRAMLGDWGDLARDGRFKGSERSGYATLPGGYANAGKLADPLTLEQLLRHQGFGPALAFEEIFDQQAPMFQPVGGMDRIAHALYETVKPRVRLGSAVTAIRKTRRGVSIEIAGAAPLAADYCLCTLPANLVGRLDAPFSPAKRAALARLPYAAASKLAWQAPRFWEDDGIYGGLAWTGEASDVVWYPSGNWNAVSGILIGAYSSGFNGIDNVYKFESMSADQRAALSRSVIERLHPGKSALLTRPLTVSWRQTKWNEGMGGDWTEGARKSDYPELCRPEYRVFFAGEHLSYLPFWQEGAALSAHEAIAALHTRAQADALTAPRRARG